MRKALLLAALAAPLACTTTGARSVPETGASARLELPPPVERAAPKPGECPPAEVRCGSEHDPVLCTARRYDEAPLHREDFVAGWGANRCKGLQSLYAEACRQGLSPELLDAVDCVPDATRGACPQEPAICTMEYAPTLCTASAYGGQQLGPGQVFRAHGSNPCRARELLLRAACAMNLDPAKVEQVTCVADETGGECPPRSAPCEEPKDPHFCEAKSPHESGTPTLLAARAPSLCAAKLELARLACSMNLKPSSLEQVLCQPGGGDQ